MFLYVFLFGYDQAAVFYSCLRFHDQEGLPLSVHFSASDVKSIADLTALAMKSSGLRHERHACFKSGMCRCTVSPTWKLTIFRCNQTSCHLFDWIVGCALATDGSVSSLIYDGNVKVRVRVCGFGGCMRLLRTKRYVMCHVHAAFEPQPPPPVPLQRCVKRGRGFYSLHQSGNVSSTPHDGNKKEKCFFSSWFPPKLADYFLIYS